jgi:glycosyltransferase involved in cell wall biosynthesis
MKDLSMLIPARNEQFLAQTVQDILQNIEADTEIIVTLDGEWANPPIPQHERVTVVYVPVSIGQRAATNIACKVAQGKYVMKVDAHCAFDKGFDRKLIEDMQDDWTVVPIMMNLHAFDWKCYSCGKRWYQDTFAANANKICDNCGSKKIKMKMVWKPRRGTRNRSFCFDTEPHFRYFSEYSCRPEGKGDLTETMSLQGSAFMLTREKYWELDICDEKLGNWGNQGIEVACKTWLSGGRVMVNQKTWYAHMFRTKPQFGFPWLASGNEALQTKKNVRDLFWENKWDKAIYPLSWLIERFSPVPSWTPEEIAKLKK